jgi:hypothetical protein
MPTSWAQQQEASLVDRLLRPNMELQNNAQGKKFIANSAVIEGRGTVGTFFLQPNRHEKSFGDLRERTARKYPSRSFYEDAGMAASLQNRNVRAATTISTSSVHSVHETQDAHSATGTRSFAGQRPFQGEGKSQKSLDRQNPPLTIEQVRELLNKNK